MKILVRLPNWLGDMVMSISFLRALQMLYPRAEISVIAKKGIDHLLEFFPVNGHQFVFSKEEFPGISGAWRFGRMIREKESFDLFFSLPDSFSAAVMGFATRARKRVGYKKEFRNFFFTQSFSKTSSLHRVDQYCDLIRKYTGQSFSSPPIEMNVSRTGTNEQIVVNVNSEASSRRLPLDIAIKIISEVQQTFRKKILLIGGKADVPHVESIINMLPDKENILNRAGKTSLGELVHLLANSEIVLTTDSGPAHVANAIGVPTVVLFGAGNEKNTAPFNPLSREIIRLGLLPCEPCVKNVCVLYGIPKCLQLLDEKKIVNCMQQLIK